MIEKKDWVKAEEMFNELDKASDDAITNAELNKELYAQLLPFIKGKIAEFPEEKKEDDPMPEELKEVLK